MKPDKETRRRELEQLSDEEIARLLRGFNPFGGHRLADVRRHRDGAIESVLRWEGYR